MREATSTRPGFTLIEVLVAVAIIALLVSVLIPSLSKAPGQARLATFAMRGNEELHCGRLT